MVKNKTLGHGVDSHEGVGGHAPDAGVEAARAALPVNREDRVRQFLENLSPYPQRMKRKEYDRAKRVLQVELVKLQNWIRDSGERVIILFEGRDAAGKGGTIRRFMEHWNPRSARVVALDKPSEVETGQWYFQRYVRHFPTKGEIVLFDRSWYNRAGVERVFGFSTESEYRLFMKQVPVFEEMIVESGIRLIKFYFSVSRDEQFRRFGKRADNPLKQWKISPIDILSRDRWDSYTAAKEAMFVRTHSATAPWTIIKSDDKKRARINAMRHVIYLIDYDGKDPTAAYLPDPSIVAAADEIYEGCAPSIPYPD